MRGSKPEAGESGGDDEASAGMAREVVEVVWRAGERRVRFRTRICGGGREAEMAP